MNDHLIIRTRFSNKIRISSPIIHNVIDIPNQEGSISKEDFKKKLSNSNLNLKLANSIEESIKSLAKNEKTITLCIGSLYLAGEILSLN